MQTRKDRVGIQQQPKKTKTVKTSVTQINPEPISCLINAVEPYMYVPLTSWPQKQAAELQINRI